MLNINSIDKDYMQLLNQIKQRIRVAQQRAILSRMARCYGCIGILAGCFTTNRKTQVGEQRFWKGYLLI